MNGFTTAVASPSEKAVLPEQDLFYRLNPRENERTGAASMFVIAAGLDLKLVQGRHWGDDYLVAPKGQAERKLVEDLLREDGIYFEPVTKLPHYLRSQID